MAAPKRTTAPARERLTFARIWDKTRRRAVGLLPRRGEITLTGLRKLALRLTLGGIMAGLVAAESRAQWGWTTPASPPPQAQAPASAPPQGGSRGENFSAGKSAAQLFSSDCTGAGCHKGPQGLARDRGTGSLASFLREHYTNSRESAASLAAYLTSVAGARADPKQPRAAARTEEKPAERKPPAAIPPAAVAAPSGETGEPAKPAARAPRGRQAVAPPAPTPPAPAAAPAPPPEPPAPVAPPEPPKPQWDIFD
jgi:hypothetical protein